MAPNDRFDCWPSSHGHARERAGERARGRARGRAGERARALIVRPATGEKSPHPYS
jgi:hypothetical protein